MHLFKKSWKYQPLLNRENKDLEHDVPKPFLAKRRCSMNTVVIVLSLALLLSLLVGALFEWTTTGPKCLYPLYRKEWRSLNTSEQQDYINAVQCLAHHPSRFFDNTSLYDDLTWAHGHIGSYTHYAAAFLPWHRMFVHVYEQFLRDICEYQGAHPYWDWTLDWEDISKSAIWDSVHGFGGNGDLETPEILNGGHCVMDGPFANVKRAWRVDPAGESHVVKYEPHCIARGFLDQDDNITDLERKRIPKIHNRISPEYVNMTLAQPDYESFFQKFEDGAHNAIPLFIRGDWITFSSPNDPVFFLHHTQVDRLWWIWQQRDPAHRLTQFHGATENFLHHMDSTGAAISDVLPMGGLVPDGTVADYMDTTGRGLCYEY